MSHTEAEGPSRIGSQPPPDCRCLQLISSQGDHRSGLSEATKNHDNFLPH